MGVGSRRRRLTRATGVVVFAAANPSVTAVAKHHGVKAFINMSQMTVSQMSITETTCDRQCFSRAFS
jgi:hypothetical protein